ncbi:MAG: right-handed parallel beta-helix repeat-containing protein [Alloprevotella sp.]|nr:right-handed parallel beta-helix repeat-containing protein [Alloprevotella sp.]
MHSKNSFSLLLSALLAPMLGLLTLTGCMEDEPFTVSAGARLTLNRDTVDLGTVIAGGLAATDTLKLFNRGSEGIRLSRVWLEGGAASPFRVNMDGTFLSGGEGGGFEVLRSDSLIAFLTFHAPDADEDEPCTYEDRLHVLTEGGAEQSIVLTACSQSVVRLDAVRITEDTEFAPARPYLVTDSLVVAEGATLTLPAGTRLLFHPEAELIVHGTLVALGEAGREVELRGDRLDNMLSQIPYDRIPGQWGGVRFTSGSYDNYLQFTDVHSGAYGLRCDSSDASRQKLTLLSSTVHNVGGDGIYARSCRLTATNCQVSNAAGNCLTLLGGCYNFIHCTVAQFYPLVQGYGVALSFSNCDGDIRLPLDELQFWNCIITGRQDDDIMGNASERYTDLAFDYYFHHCLLNTPKVSDEAAEGHFVNCLWENDDKEHRRSANFSPEFDYDRLIFTFGLDSLSRAVGAADPEVSRTAAPADRLGRSRLGDAAPDMGCFERQEGLAD